METQELRETRGLQVGDFSRSADTGPGEAGVWGQGRCFGFVAAGPTRLGQQEAGDQVSLTAEQQISTQTVLGTTLNKLKAV